MKITRRFFLKQGGVALAAVGGASVLGPLFLRRTAFAAGARSGRRKTLICLFQRGAVDGLSMVVPHGDPFYYRHRTVGGSGIALPRTGEGAVIDLDGYFGLHPALAPLKPLYDAGHCVPVHAVGSPDATRSHFDAQDYLETGAPGNKSVRNGWLARVLAHSPEDKRLFRSVALTAQVPRSLQGDPDVLAVPDLRSFALGAGAAGQSHVPAFPSHSGGGFEALYDQAVGDVLHGTGRESFEAIRRLERLHLDDYVPAGQAHYPQGQFGQALQQIAQLVKADVGLEIAFAECGGWDTHVGQGGAQGQLAQRLAEFGQGLAALYKDLDDRMEDVVIVTMSEFGRTARQNGGGGTDHGHATCFFVLGGPLHGGRVVGQWPGLAPEQLYEGRDLALTTDFRSLFAELAVRHLAVADPSVLFPGYRVGAAQFPGVLRV